MWKGVRFYVVLFKFEELLFNAVRFTRFLSKNFVTSSYFFYNNIFVVFLIEKGCEDTRAKVIF